MWNTVQLFRSWPAGKMVTPFTPRSALSLLTCVLRCTSGGSAAGWGVEVAGSCLHSVLPTNPISNIVRLGELQVNQQAKEVDLDIQGL